MEFTFWFLRSFLLLVLLASPILLFLALLILFLGLIVVRLEKWKTGFVGSFYYSFVTATTIGYGDFTPVRKAARVLAVCIGFIGLVMTGIIVALGLEAAKIGLRHVAEDQNRSAHVKWFEDKIYKGLDRERHVEE